MRTRFNSVGDETESRRGLLTKVYLAGDSYGMHGGARPGLLCGDPEQELPRRTQRFRPRGGLQRRCALQWLLRQTPAEFLASICSWVPSIRLVFCRRARAVRGRKLTVGPIAAHASPADLLRPDNPSSTNRLYPQAADRFRQLRGNDPGTRVQPLTAHQNPILTRAGCVIADALYR